MTDGAVNSPAWWNEYFRLHWEARGGREQTRGFMQQVVRALPRDVAGYLRKPDRTILDWGCAMGDGVDELAGAFPRARVAGVDASEVAIARARTLFPPHRFACGAGADSAEPYDVLITSNCLEHFADPQAILRQQMRGVRGLYLALVPFEEDPLCEYHRVRFDANSFPPAVGGFVKHAQMILDLDGTGLWDGRQLLVIYRWHRLVLDEPAAAAGPDEADAPPHQALWDRVAEQYAPEINPAERELAGEICGLLAAHGCDPPASLLEAGSGSGHLSALLAAEGYRASLMDFSAAALAKARACFDHFGYSGQFVRGDLFAAPYGDQKFDVVWNSGVLEHFEHPQLVGALAAMARLARRSVVVLVPNPRSLPYLLFRYKLMREGRWPYGTEHLDQDLPAAFAEAGLTLVAQSYAMNSMCIDYLRDVLHAPEAAALYREASEHGLLPAEQSYLTAYVARVGAAPAGRPRTEKPRDAATGLRTALFDLTARFVGVRAEHGASDAASARLTALVDQVGACTHELHDALALQQAEAERAGRIAALEPALRDAEQARDEAAALAADQSRALDTLRSRIIAFEQTLHAAVEADRRTRSSKLVRALRRSWRQFARGSWSDRRAFLGWALRQTRGQSSADGWRFDMQLPAVASLLEGLDRPAEGALPAAAGPAAPRTRVGLARIREFLHANQQASGLVLIASGVEYDEWKNQRATQLAHEMLRQGQAVLFAYFRWSPDEPVRTPPGPTNLLSVPLDEIVAYGSALLAESAGPSDRRILIEMPHPDLLELVSQARLSGWHTTYDIIDDWHEFFRCGQATWYDRSFEQYLVRWCDAVTAVSPPLCDRFASTRQAAIACVPNAVSPERYPTPTRRPADNPPVIGYVGHLTASWFDYKLLAALAAARPDCRFELVGYGADEAPARCGDNVSFLGPRDPRDVAQLAARWRLALIPFKPGALAEAVSPLKLYEYLLWGVPVLVTGIPHLADLPGVSYAGDADEAVARMNERLAEPVDPEPLRAFAHQNTWRHRVEALAAAVAQPAPPGRPPVDPAPSSPPLPETSVPAEPQRVEHRVLFVYQYCSHGGVETSLRSRAVGGRACGLEAEFAFYRDLGGRSLFADFHHEFVSSTEDLVALVHRRGYDLVDIIDTPAAVEALDSLGDQPACLEVHTTYPESLQYLATVPLDRFGFVVVPSEMMKRHLIRNVAAVRPHADRLVVLPNAVDTTMFRVHEVATPPVPIALFVGRLDAHKNWRLFLDGLARLDPPAIGWVVGGARSGPDEKAAFWRKVTARGLAHRVCWLPDVPHNAMPAIYSAVAGSGGALVVTSVAESFGMTILEAAACGCPSVAGPEAGIAAAWAERGLLTLLPGRKPRDLARRLATLIGQDRGEREALARRLRQEAEAHVSTAIARRFVAQLEQALASRGGAARPARSVEVAEIAKPCA